MDAAILDDILTVTAEWGRRCRLDEGQIVTAQSLAWYWASRCETPYPPHYWARLAVRAVHSGRDFAGCATGPTDAIRHAWLTGGMPEKIDPTPGPDTLAEYKEQFERAFGRLADLKQEFLALKIAGLSNLEAVRRLGLSPTRGSQIAREFWEAFKE